MKNKTAKSSGPLPANPRGPAVQVQQIHATMQSGPIPPPEALEYYNRIVPGAAERIIIMAEKQSEHRRSIESVVIRAGARDSLLGIISGFLLGCFSIATAVYMVSLGQSLQGTIFGGIGIVSLAGVFVYGTRSRREERERKSGLK